MLTFSVSCAFIAGHLFRNPCREPTEHRSCSRRHRLEPRGSRENSSVGLLHWGRGALGKAPMSAWCSASCYQGAGKRRPPRQQAASWPKGENRSAWPVRSGLRSHQRPHWLLGRGALGNASVPAFACCSQGARTRRIRRLQAASRSRRHGQMPCWLVGHRCRALWSAPGAARCPATCC